MRATRGGGADVVAGRASSKLVLHYSVGGARCSSCRRPYALAVFPFLAPLPLLALSSYRSKAARR